MGRKKKFRYNRVLKLSDYDELGVNHRKGWEVAMALKTLRELGVTSPEAMILGVGAAREGTIYHLANAEDSRFVIPTDMYLDMGVWSDWAGTDFLKHPGNFSKGIVCNPWQILPRHADMCALPFPDDAFDGIFSSGSIEHVGREGIADYDAIAKAAGEIGRVLKPGGIASLSTEWKISGEGWGWSHVRLFTEETLMKYIVEASGLELVDDFDFDYDGDVAEAVSLNDIVAGRAIDQNHGLVKSHQFTFTSVHLALRKA